ncbi:MAG: reverse transcriptase domain-containing protein [Myxococcota bacterium]
MRWSPGGAPRGGLPWGALLGGVPWRARAWEALPWGGPPWASVPWGTSAVRPITPAQGAGVADELCSWLVGRWLRAWQSGVGVPTGTSVSPALSNAYFGASVDPWIVSELRRGRIAAAVRYADDFALLVPGDGVQALAGIEQVLAGVGLRLNHSKTRMHRADGPWPATVLGVDLAPSGGRLRGCV